MKPLDRFVRRIHGIIAAILLTLGCTVRAQPATGGTVTQNGSTYTHVFTTSGTLVVNSGLTGVRVLVVAGGGGGGQGPYSAGGGGAGGVLYVTNQSIAIGSFAVTVGAGGEVGYSYDFIGVTVGANCTYIVKAADTAGNLSTADMLNVSTSPVIRDGGFSNYILRLRDAASSICVSIG